MSLKKLKNLNRSEGFTLVELLIVIVVIGILAAITLVAYNGVQQKAHTASAQSAASEVVKKASIYATENNGSFPADYTYLAGTNTSGTKITSSDPAFVSSTDVTFVTAAPTAAPTSDNTIYYAQCGSGTGGSATYWNFSTAAAVTLKAGTGC
ncbi:MAG TPA: type II secretion system protein [Candidatus Saccharimonadaceae bacterium]|nr:type II secretion system protein [Candidatus Saccharimonadaceae bacterium]